MRRVDGEGEVERGVELVAVDVVLQVPPVGEGEARDGLDLGVAFGGEAEREEGEEGGCEEGGLHFGDGDSCESTEMGR